MCLRLGPQVKISPANATEQDSVSNKTNKRTRQAFSAYDCSAPPYFQTRPPSVFVPLSAFVWFGQGIIWLLCSQSSAWPGSDRRKRREMDARPECSTEQNPASQRALQARGSGRTLTMLTVTIAEYLGTVQQLRHCLGHAGTEMQSHGA